MMSFCTAHDSHSICKSVEELVCGNYVYGLICVGLICVYIHLYILQSISACFNERERNIIGRDSIFIQDAMSIKVTEF